MAPRRSIALGVPGRWELEVAGDESFVLEMAERLGLFTHATPVALGGPGSAARRVADVLPAAVHVPDQGHAGPPRQVDEAQHAPGIEQGRSGEDADLEDDMAEVEGEGLTVDVFYRRFIRGRDAATLSQDELALLFGYYMEEHMEKATWTALDLSMCFTLAGLEQPRNTIGVLSTMARQKGTIVQDAPGEYCLSDKSRAMIKAVMSA